jgi:hypothetical protein
MSYKIDIPHKQISCQLWYQLADELEDQFNKYSGLVLDLNDKSLFELESNLLDVMEIFNYDL